MKDQNDRSSYMDFRRRPKSSWIWTEEWKHADNEKPALVLFRKTFDLQDKPKSYLINVSADSRYRLYVNGISVSIGPCKGDDTVWYYETVDVEQYLNIGENAISAVVLRYPTDNRYNHSVWRTSIPGLYVDGKIEFADGKTEQFKADETWKSIINRNVKIVADKGDRFLYINEIAKGSTTLHGWTLPGYDDSSWYGVKVYSPFEVHGAISPGNLTERPIPFMYEEEKKFQKIMMIRQSAKSEDEWNSLLAGNRHIEIAANTTEIVELNAGEHTTGYLNFGFANGAGATVNILSSESYVYPLKDQSSPYPRYEKGDRIDYVNGILNGYTDTYTVGGFGTIDSPETYEPFWFRTFRFVRLEIKTGNEPLLISNISYRETGYPLEVKTEAAASDPDFEGIWDISLRSLKRCMHETYEDCPFYEQLQYAMDTRSQILFTYMVSADDRMARRTIDDFHRSQRPDGMINCCYPSYGPNIIPSFSIYYMLMIHDHMMFFGDKELVRRYLPTVDGILEFFHRSLDERGLVSRIGGPLGRHKFWSFIDWTSDWNKTMGVPDAILDGPITMESFLYVYALTHAAELAEFAGRPGVSDEYRQRATAVREAIQKHCIGSNGLYQDGPGIDKYSQHCQAFAVLTDTADPSKVASIMQTALDDPSLTKSSVAFMFYMFRALEKAGLYHRTEELWKPWRDMLKENLTTCVENDTGKRSDCHAWGSLLLYELPAVILGVRPAKPGFKAVKVSPVPGYLSWANGNVVTPHGNISVSWKRTESDIIVDIDAPKGVEIIR
jgi:alpha-L-rhamnosidase